MSELAALTPRSPEEHIAFYLTNPDTPLYDREKIAAFMKRFAGPEREIIATVTAHGAYLHYYKPLDGED